MCRKPVGLGAKRTTGRHAAMVVAVIPGAHVSTAGGIAHRHRPQPRRSAASPSSSSPRARARGGPTKHDPAERRALPRAARPRPGSRAVVRHALYLVNLATPDEEIYEKAVTTLENSDGRRRARSRPTASSSTWAHTSAPGFEAGLEHVVPALERALEHCSERDLAPDRELGRRGRDDRPLRGRARRARRPARPPSAPRRLPRLVPPLGLGRRRHRPEALDALRRGGRGADRARPPARAARERRRGGARLEPRPAREHGRRRDRRRARACSSRTRSFRACRRSSRSRGPDGHGPDANEIQKLRDLHARGLNGAS